jgi:transcriptional regulator with XRE-family HTH domain
MERTSLTMRFGRAVRQLRLDQGMSQEDFADACDLHRTYIGAIERGEKTVTIETARKVADALKLPLWKLLKRVEEE